MFDHCVGGRVYFGGGTLVWVLSSPSCQDMTKFLGVTRVLHYLSIKNKRHYG